MRPSARSTAAQLRATADVDGWSPWALVQRISEQAEVSLAQAHRLARGWTLAQACAAYRDLRAPVTVQQMSSWETGSVRPGETHLDGLCELYRTRPDRLGWGRDYTPAGQPDDPGGARPPLSGQVVRRGSTAASAEQRAILQDLLGGLGPAIPGHVLHALAGARQGMAETLSDGLAETTIDQLERSAAELGQAYQVVPPARMLGGAVLDFVEVQQVLSRRQPADRRSRLCHVAAQLAGAAGMALVALGSQREAREWFRVAQLAAEETGDRALRAWLLCREAVIPFYGGNPAAAARLAERARMVAGSTVCATAAWAPALEARSLARLGRDEDARAAMAIAVRAFERLDERHTADLAYGYTLRQLRWHVGSMHTALGDTRRAHLALDEALTLYSPAERLDRALIALDQADGLIGVGEITTGAQVGVDALESLPDEHRTGIVVSRAREVLAAVPARAARGVAVAELRELVQPPAAPELEG
ncbi:hypothetical protein [Kitasatospora fiedleri]|uniref:hypothetical protein n=1 Tax=Kitasatospora fiedleri TaxID=2991545 RepID=UPI00249ACFA2|nr:hypothetical protein [Kitasatospora fiedleri]